MNSFASIFNQISFIIILPASTWYICDFFLFHIEIEGKGGWIILGGGGGRYVGPLSNYCGGGLVSLTPLFLRL